jgi:protein-S-isoprenylcysteine O-methyltransferase Ste14
MKNLVMDWGERLILVILFALFAMTNLRSGDAINAIILLGEALTIYFVLTRRQAISITERPMDWLLAFAGTLLPMVGRPGGEAVGGWLAGVLLIGGTALALAAKLSLNRRFGIAPANRGVQADWVYALVRHPMYLGYIIAQVGYLLHNPTPRNVVVYGLAWMFQLARIAREERHLMQDPAYQSYAGRVRHRLVPGVY